MMHTTPPRLLNSDASDTSCDMTLDYLPIGLFGSVMGLVGLSAAWSLAHAHFGAPSLVGSLIGAAAVAAFLAVAAGYGIKIMTAPEAVAAEFRDPISGNLFGTVLISLLLLPIVVAPVAMRLAEVLWIVGAIGMFAFAWLVVTRWMSDRQQVAHATPAWIVPVVGLLDVPPALPFLDLPAMHGAMVAAMAIGLFFAVPLFTLIFQRLIFEAPMSDVQQSSLLILVAPFAVGASTWSLTVGKFDLFAESLFMLSMFVFAVLLRHMRRLLVSSPFRVSWWATSFPLASLATASLRFAVAQPSWISDALAALFLTIATLAIGALFCRTVLGLVRGELRTLSC